ncbi:lysophosphatidic acid receptor 5b [Esox lucius]|uniref:G-protein coupled receptors family 1 profile domain-containing protein n=1 Tax=Esox lucius TaxID=8010 RepID=A0AAY5K2M8_ESOLU|nr:lysophosphatidic acid receptor 5b [Esox lucius]
MVWPLLNSHTHPHTAQPVLKEQSYSTLMTTNEQSEETMKNTAYAVVFGGVLAVGLPLNAVALWVLVCRHRLKSSSSVFMSHLALSDILLVLSLPTRVYFFATGNWPLSMHACVIATMLFRNNIRSSSFFITFISLDRLLAVVYPLRSRHLRTSANAWKTSIVTWILIVSLNIPESINYLKSMTKDQTINNTNSTNTINITNTTNTTNTPNCFIFNGHNCPYIAYVQSGVIFALLGVNMASTAMVSRILHSHLSNAALVKNKINVMLIFAMNLLMFIVFFLPFSIVLMLGVDPKTAICLASVNCCVDPLLYYFSLDAFWKKKEGSDVEISLARSNENKLELRTQ